MSLAGIAKANERIVADGHYTTARGQLVELAGSVAASLAGTHLYRPGELGSLLEAAEGASPGRARVRVVESKTGEAARSLARETGAVPVALNFASARNPGGGYVRGARAQEEDLARCSALHATQLTQREYYDANRATSSLLYTDHLIYSPSVPFFRDERYELLDEPVLVSVITAPAPNAGEVLRQGQAGQIDIERTLRRRAGMVLAVAAARGDRNLVLGAWGCGVFRNDPSTVADSFGYWLESSRFAGRFDDVVFAIYTRGGERRTLEAFQERFGS